MIRQHEVSIIWIRENGYIVLIINGWQASGGMQNIYRNHGIGIALQVITIAIGSRTAHAISDVETYCIVPCGSISMGRILRSIMKGIISPVPIIMNGWGAIRLIDDKISMGNEIGRASCRE